ncbi:MAG: hypothetical protein ACOC3Z_02535 [Nanoarchaeota archaeon]
MDKLKFISEIVCIFYKEKDLITSFDVISLKNKNLFVSFSKERAYYSSSFFKDHSNKRYHISDIKNRISKTVNIEEYREIYGI